MTGPTTRQPGHGLRLLATVTFKANQLQAHLLPIVQLDEVEEIKLVTDAPGPPLAKVTPVVPPRWLVRIAGRALAKFAVCLVLAVRERPDWILAYHILPHGMTASFIGRLTGCKVLYHQIGGPEEWRGGGWTSGNPVLGRLQRPVPALEALLLWLIRGCTVVGTMGEQGRRALVERGVPPERIVVTPPSVDTERFRPPMERRCDYDIVTVGDLIEVKRTQDLVAAAARLLPDHPSLRVAVVGSGPREQELRDLAARLGVAGVVDFLGFRADVESVLGRSGIFVLPSQSEGRSVALAEAMACGLPAVVSDVGEARDLVREGRSGALHPVGDIDALVGHLRVLLRDPELREAYGAAAASDTRDSAAVASISPIYRKILLSARP